MTAVAQAAAVKQEAGNDDDDDEDYLKLSSFQQKLSYDENAAAGPSATATSDEPPRKRQRRTAAVKAQINIQPESDDEDDMSGGEPSTKVEDESEESDNEGERETAFVDVLGGNAAGDDQPGPSGVGKDAVEAPFLPEVEVKIDIEEHALTLDQNTLKIKIKRTPRRKKVGSLNQGDPDDDEYVPPGTKKGKRSPRKSLVKEEKIKKQEHKTWTCRKCLHEFDTRKSLLDHMKIHGEDTPKEHTFKYDNEQDLYICNTCSSEFQTKEEVEKHITSAHEEFYSCEVCNHNSKTAYSFAVHMKIHSNDDMLTCPLCSYQTHRKTCLQTHINRVHYQKFYYTCGQCGKGFNDSNMFKEHNNEHLGIKPFVCVVCNKEFVYSRYMLIHQVRHHTVYIEGILHKTQCSICFKVFSKVDTLLKHITTKHQPGSEKNERKHLCDLCGKGFATGDKLKIHYRIHTGEKPFSCRFCQKRFTKRDYLVMHERVHTGEKPFICPHCGKCFNQSASLRIHVRGHTGERPYKCQFCNGGYISRGSLNLHLKICNGMPQ